ncbi:MAG: hypothetical protein ABL958_10675 [Bdellovibrionia bacterium]
MKTLIMTVVGMLLLTISAEARRLDRREFRQRARIGEGVQSGDLNRGERRSLARLQINIERTERRAQRDGLVTADEKLKIERMQDRAMQGKIIALATFDGLPELSDDDRLLKRELESGGARVETPLWHDPEIEWGEFDAVVLRSVWDYHKRPQEFLNWLEDLESENARVFNPLAALRWNFSKRYLLELETMGCPIVPSHILKRGDRIDLADFLTKNGWSEAVVKPVISASALKTKRVAASDARFFQKKFETWLEDGDLIVQPFVPDILTAGEYSLLYFGSEYSHSVLKKPKDGDFRVQQEYGGRTASVQPPQDVKRLVDDLNQWLFEKFREPMLFARFDIVTIDGKPAVGEIELIEPFLFFSYHGPSTGLFKKSLEKALKKAD